MPGDFDLVKDRVDIVQLIGERVPLKKAGKSYTGLCPFHNEKTPSFHVDADRKTFKCFGCGVGGDAFTWLEKIDGLEPVEALKALAERAGVELSTRAPAERESDKRLLAIHEKAHFYYRQAWRGTDAGKAAAEYVAGRGVTPETVDRFGIGYAPDLMSGLLTYLRKNGFTDEEAVTSGLISRNDRGPFDRFRHRVMIPIRDAKGRIIAFVGRALRADQPGKYVNSPATPLFTKGATLFALDLARPAMRRTREVVIVEGQFDAVSCHQAGFDNVVASMGTALTGDQYAMLKSLKLERAIVAFDGDPAGMAAAEKRGRELVTHMQRIRTGGLSLRTELGLYVTELPAGKDSDDLARTEPELLRRLLALRREGQETGAVPVLEYVIGKIAARFDLAGADGRRRFLAEALPLLADEPDELTRELYLGTLSRLTGVEQEVLRQQSSHVQRVEPSRATAGVGGGGAAPRAVSEQASGLERYVIAQLVQFPEAAAHVDLVPADLVDPELRAIFEHLRSGRPVSALPVSFAARAAALGALAPEPVGDTDPVNAIEIAVLHIREQSLVRQLKEAQAALVRSDGGDSGGAVGDTVQRLVTELGDVMRRRESRTVLRTDERVED